MYIWRYIDSGLSTAAENMAVDEKLLGQAVKGEAATVLRFYGWDPPAVSLGRFQELASSVNEEACRGLGIDIVRRITGGRAVLHDRELTYSVVSRTDNPLFPDDVLGTYKVIASGLLAGLHYLGIEAELVSRGGRNAELVKKDSKDPSCFSSPSWYEIVVNGKKLVGSAQRRVAGAFLQHGSILIQYDPAREAQVIPGAGGCNSITCVERELGRTVALEEVKQAMLKGLTEALDVAWR